jgi:transcriptional regulator with XRE-family HTH domain
MHIGQTIRAWRISKGQTVESLSDMAGISAAHLEQIEAEQTDPSTSTVRALATAFRIPPAWLFDTPQSFDCLFRDADDAEGPASTQLDPITERILAGSSTDRSLYILLTVLMQAGDPKLLCAAEMSLRSLVKQCRQASVPWQQRQPGHFEPPSD